MLGLAGYSPASINPDVADDDFSKIITEGILMLNGEKSVKFHLDEDLIFYKEIELPCHPNGMTIQAYGVPDEEGGDNLLLSETYYSIGGGFIRRRLSPPRPSGTAREQYNLFSFGRFLIYQ